MAQLGTLSIDFLVNLQNSLNQVGQLENRIAELERTARDSRRAVDDIGNARIGNIAGAFDDATDGINRFRGGLQGVLSGGGGIGDLIGAFKGIPPQALLAAGSVIAITGAVVGLGFAIKSSLSSLVQQGDELDKASQRAGVSVEALQQLRYAAELSGIGADKLTDAFKEVNNALGQGKEGEKAKIFEQMGVSITDATGKIKSADQMLIESADTFKNLGSDTERAVLAMKLFGEGGKELVPLLKQGTDAVREQMKELDELGGVLGGDTVKATVELSDQMTRIKTLMGGVSNSFAEIFLPSAKLVVDVFLEIAKAIKGSLPEGESFKDLVLSITKSGLRLMIQAIDATVKKINQFGSMLIVAAPLIENVYQQIMFVVDAAIILVNALDILKSFIQVAVITVVEELVKAFGALVGAIGDVAATVGLDSVAEQASNAKSSIDAMSGAFASIRQSGLDSIKTDWEDINNAIDSSTKRIKSYGEATKNIQSVGQSLADLQSPTSGANDAINRLTDAVNNNTDANKQNTGATDKNTDEGKKNAANAAKGGAAAKAIPRIESPVETYERLSGRELNIEPGFKKSEALKEIVEPANVKLKEIEKSMEAERQRSLELERKANSTQLQIIQRKKQLKEKDDKLDELRSNEIDLEFERSDLQEELYKSEQKNRDYAKKRAELFGDEVELLEARQKDIEKLTSKVPEGLPGSGQMQNVLEGGFRGANVLRDAAATVGIGKPRRKAKMAETRGELAEMEPANERSIENSKKLAKVNEEILAIDNERIIANSEINNLSELQAQQDAQKLQSQKALSNYEAQYQAQKNLISKTQMDINLAEIEYISLLNMKLTLLNNENALITEQDVKKREALQLENAGIRYELAMIELQSKKLEGLEYQAEAQEIINEHTREEYEIRQRTFEANNSALEAAKQAVEAAKARGAELANINALASKEIEILNTKNVFNRLDLEYALEKLKTNIQNLTPLQQELELLKAKLDYEEKIKQARAGQVEKLGQGFSGAGQIAGGLGDLINKIGGTGKEDDMEFQDMLRQIDNVSGALGGLGQASSGVARIMSGDLIGGITSLITGLMSTVGSVYDFFFGETEQEKKDREEREKQDEEARFDDVTQIFFDNAALRQQAEEFAKAFVSEQEKRMGRPVEITIDARGALIGEENEIARSLGNLLETELGRRVGNAGIGRF